MTLGRDFAGTVEAIGDGVTSVAARGPGRTNVTAAPSPDALDRIARMLADGSLKLAITATYALADAPTALAHLGAKHAKGKLGVRVE